jgi:hypothetical protein
MPSNPADPGTKRTISPPIEQIALWSMIWTVALARWCYMQSQRIDLIYWVVEYIAVQIRTRTLKVQRILSDESLISRAVVSSSGVIQSSAVVLATGELVGIWARRTERRGRTKRRIDIPRSAAGFDQRDRRAEGVVQVSRDRGIQPIIQKLCRRPRDGLALPPPERIIDEACSRPPANRRQMIARVVGVGIGSRCRSDCRWRRTPVSHR